MGQAPSARPRRDQLPLDLPQRPALGEEDFLVSASNEEAVRLIDRWPDWPSWAAVVAGPAHCGKTHLANVWRARSNAEQLDSTRMTVDSIAAAAGHETIVVEDIDRGIGDEQALFLPRGGACFPAFLQLFAVGKIRPPGLLLGGFY